MIQCWTVILNARRVVSTGGIGRTVRRGIRHYGHVGHHTAHHIYHVARAIVVCTVVGGGFGWAWHEYAPPGVLVPVGGGYSPSSIQIPGGPSWGSSPPGTAEESFGPSGLSSAPHSVPEPASLALLAVGIVGLVVARRR